MWAVKRVSCDMFLLSLEWIQHTDCHSKKKKNMEVCVLLLVAFAGHNP